MCPPANTPSTPSRTRTSGRIILSKNLKLWGAYGYKPDADALRVTAKPTALADPVESFTIGFEDLKDDGATIALEWDKTRVPVELTTNTMEKVNAANLDGAEESEGARSAIFYYQAASFYYEHDKDLDAGREMGRSSDREATAAALFPLLQEGADRGEARPQGCSQSRRREIDRALEGRGKSGRIGHPEQPVADRQSALTISDRPVSSRIVHVSGLALSRGGLCSRSLVWLHAAPLKRRARWIRRRFVSRSRS